MAIFIGDLKVPMLKGEKGDTGAQGIQGIQGIQGVPRSKCDNCNWNSYYWRIR